MCWSNGQAVYMPNGLRIYKTNLLGLFELTGQGRVKQLKRSIYFFPLNWQDSDIPDSNFCYRWLNAFNILEKKINAVTWGPTLYVRYLWTIKELCFLRNFFFVSCIDWALNKNVMLIICGHSYGKKVDIHSLHS